MDKNKLNYSHQIFNALKMVHENELCFDCGKTPSNWVSLENGVFLCAKCAGKQRNFPDNKFTLLSIICFTISNYHHLPYSYIRFYCIIPITDID